MDKKAAMAAAALCRGGQMAARDYQDEVGKAFAEYLLTRYRCYAAEKRWSTAPFWRRRLLPPKPIGGAIAAVQGAK